MKPYYLRVIKICKKGEEETNFFFAILLQWLINFSRNACS